MQALRELAARDPSAALGQLSQWSAREERDEALAQICLEWSARDPAAAAAAAWRFDLGAGEEAATVAVLDQLADRWAVRDFPAALAWASALPVAEHDGRRDRFLGRLALFQAETEPVRAARLVAEKISPGPEQVAAALAVIQHWNRVDPSAARAWAEQFTAEELRETARRNLARAATSEVQP